jgi:protein arginine N-methyltransferase 1
LPVDSVDIILSEWMGYCLLYEGMLSCVLEAKRRWLRPGGLMFPDRATLYLSVIKDPEVRKTKIDYWNDVYGVSMRSIKETALKEPLVEILDED